MAKAPWNSQLRHTNQLWSQSNPTAYLIEAMNEEHSPVGFSSPRIDSQPSNKSPAIRGILGTTSSAATANAIGGSIPKPSPLVVTNLLSKWFDFEKHGSNSFASLDSILNMIIAHVQQQDIITNTNSSHAQSVKALFSSSYMDDITKSLAITKAQAIIRGYLERRALRLGYGNDFKQVPKIYRRIGKLGMIIIRNCGPSSCSLLRSRQSKKVWPCHPRDSYPSELPWLCCRSIRHNRADIREIPRLLESRMIGAKHGCSAPSMC